MISSRGKEILLSVAVFFVFHTALVFSTDNLVPAQAKLLFQDDFSASTWQGVKIESDDKYGISGKVLVPSVYGDTVHIERQVNFSLEQESFLSFERFAVPDTSV